MPDIAIRTTLICGFPGENQAQHEELLDFIRQMKFDRLGAFSYPDRSRHPPRISSIRCPRRRRNLWADEGRELQQEVSAAKNETFVGKTAGSLRGGQGGGRAGVYRQDLPGCPGRGRLRFHLHRSGNL